MRHEKRASGMDNLDVRRLRILSLAAVACLWPAIAVAAQPPDPANSDNKANTADGTNALLNITTGEYNTGIGYFAVRREREV